MPGELRCTEVVLGTATPLCFEVATVPLMQPVGDFTRDGRTDGWAFQLDTWALEGFRSNGAGMEVAWTIDGGDSGNGWFLGLVTGPEVSTLAMVEHNMFPAAEMLFYQGLEGSTPSIVQTVAFEVTKPFNSLQVVDFDFDGDEDIVLMEEFHTEFYVLTNQGAAGFDPAVTVPLVEDPYPFSGDYALADIDGDQRLDAVASGVPEHAIYFGEPDGTFSGPLIGFIGNIFSAADGALVDINGDGRTDIIQDDFSRTFVLLSEGRDPMTPLVFDFEALIPEEIRPATRSIVASNLDGDPAPEIVALLMTQSSLQAVIFILDDITDGGVGTAHQLGFAPCSYPSQGAAQLDMDGDGAGDIYIPVSPGCDETLGTVLLNRGAG